jgi:anaerobic ribonucleoside-triphosphate reductase activating protein
MLKYLQTEVVFEEIPIEISLAINITNCQNNCIGCHSPYLRENIGDELTTDSIDSLIEKNKGITCILFMGEGNDREMLLELAAYVKNEKHLKTALYSGRKEVESEFYNVFDYVKVGSYIDEYGPLNKETTNQRLYQVVDGEIIDITSRFWKS